MIFRAPKENIGDIRRFKKSTSAIQIYFNIIFADGSVGNSSAAAYFYQS